MKTGDRVRTPYGMGNVVYVRFLASDPYRPNAVSVKLDKRKDDPDYAGTIVPYAEVVLEKALN